MKLVIPVTPKNRARIYGSTPLLRKIALCVTSRMGATMPHFSKNDHPYCVSNAIHPKDTPQRLLPVI
jgi:hypothetical protein